MTTHQLDHVADQLLHLQTELRRFTSASIGSVTGGPFNNNFFPWPYKPSSPFASLLARLPRNARVHLVHGDLLPRNILVNGSTITAILDWEFAGFYPDFWEYVRMHHRAFGSPGWDYVLARLFPGPYQEELVNTVDKIISLMMVNLSIDS
ncbi:hypothetical protein C2E23DRAFT_724963 [Lenzites betulinus]|nr:hypothetical protein C2E23DRAFT_724963 [Lenzites betulinus]